jgi:phosphoribosyl 1,2-cyclic phosphodiesterase
LILDSGSGIRRLGNDLVQESNGAALQADIIISHAHWDHIQGFPFFAPAYSPANRFRVLQSKRSGLSLETALRDQMESLHFPVSLDKMHGISSIDEMGSEPVALGPYSVRSAALNHPGGCAGFCIETEYGSIAYLPDHEPFCSVSLNRRALDQENARKDELVRFLRGVDLLILDTQYTAEEYPSHVGWGHGCLPDSVALALEAEVGQLAFFHHDPSHTDDQIDQMVQAAFLTAASSNLKISAATEMQPVVLRGSDSGEDTVRTPGYRVAALG